MDPRGLDELGLAPVERLRVGVPGRHEHTYRRHREIALLQRPAGLWHLLQRPGHAHVLARASPRHLERGGEPGRRRQVPVSLEQPPPLDLREAPQPLDLELLHGPLELGEVLLDTGVGLVENAVGLAAAANVTTTIHHVDGHDVCRVDVEPSGHPAEAEVTVADEQGRFGKRRLFYVRLNNRTRAIEDESERARYIA